MKKISPVLFLAKHFAQQWLGKSSSKLLLLLLLILSLYGQYSQGFALQADENTKIMLAQKVRQDWVHSPDKHPHRMAHYGYLVFHRASHHSLFDAGLQAQFGNSIFLEAHKQNSNNFSHESLASYHGLFGVLDSAKILQILLVLMLIFIGYGSVAQYREHNQWLFMQVHGLQAWQLLWGHSLGLWALAMLCSSLVFGGQILCFISLDFAWHGPIMALLYAYYGLYFFVVCAGIVAVSAMFRRSQQALYALLSGWVLLYVLLPKLASQTMQNYHPIPNTAEFLHQIESRIMALGDSHNPNDVHFKKIKDSVLAANHVDSPEALSFNFKAYIMARGEALSSQVYAQALEDLNQKINQQNQWQDLLAYALPSVALQQMSAAYCHSDLPHYRHFLKQVEDYRYQLAQSMNALQLKHISNQKLSDTAPNPKISQAHWQTFPDFKPKLLSTAHLNAQQQGHQLVLWLWVLLLVLLLRFGANKLCNL